jgi:hypothetical protein
MIYISYDSLHGRERERERQKERERERERERNKKKQQQNRPDKKTEQYLDNAGWVTQYT